MKPFTSEDLARILCAVDEQILIDALALRQIKCPTTIETIIVYLDLLSFLISLVPAVGPFLARLLPPLVGSLRGVARYLRALMGARQIVVPQVSGETRELVEQVR